MALAHLHRDDRRFCAVLGLQPITDAREQVRIDPIDRETVRREQTQRAVALERLQRAHPSIEVRLR